MFKILFFIVLATAAFLMLRRYRHRLLARAPLAAHGVAAVLTLGATLPGSVLTRAGGSSGLRLAVAWGLGGAALGWAIWLAVNGAAVDAPPGSLQSIKYLLPAALGGAALTLRSVNRLAERTQLPAPLAQRLDRQACFLFFCGTGIWLMAAVLHDYLSAGLSNPRLAPWVNNAYWLLASGLIATGLLSEIRRRWLLRGLARALERRQEAFDLTDFAGRAQSRFPWSLRRTLRVFCQAWATHQEAVGRIESLTLNGRQWVFDREYYAATLLTLLALPIYRARQASACRQWLAEHFNLPEAAAQALLKRVDAGTA